MTAMPPGAMCTLATLSRAPRAECQVPATPRLGWRSRSFNNRPGLE
ncbi:Hypothetical protein A7982_03898 [Minicystis rosea]|nr:Hypothetical protein A7982_03898 [Minicystis rosea]